MTSHSPNPSLYGRLRRSLGYADFDKLPRGISFEGARHPTRSVRFLADMTYLDRGGNRQLLHEIFDTMLAAIARAQRFILLDVFMLNHLLIQEGVSVRPLGKELTDALIARKRDVPGIVVTLITDPCNTLYGAVPSPYHEALRHAGIDVIVTNVLPLRDSSPIYSFLWRLLVRPFGNSTGGSMPNPFGGPPKIPLRSYLAILNVKANHRKTMLCDSGDNWVGFVSTANPHDASYAHRNVAVRFEGPAVNDLWQTERAVLQLTGVDPPDIEINPPAEDSDTTVQVVTEGKIRRAVVGVINEARSGDTIDMILFYIADHHVVAAIRRARQRGVIVRMVLDANKDAFGWKKSGIPNRPVAHLLHAFGVDIRWADTRGEQCHSKMLLARLADNRAILIVGSANFTRRNLADFNLETDVRVEGPSTSEAIAKATATFDAIWKNEDDRTYTVDYSRYQEPSRTQRVLYWLMETTGISTF